MGTQYTEEKNRNWKSGQKKKLSFIFDISFLLFFFKYAVNNFWAFLNFFFSPQNWLTFLTCSTRQTGK